MIVFCSIYYDNLFWFNIQLAKKSCRWQIFIFMQNVTFLFLSFLNLGAQISCPQNRYTDLKSALDQPLRKSTFINRKTEFCKNSASQLWPKHCSQQFKWATSQDNRGFIMANFEKFHDFSKHSPTICSSIYP